jgi:type III pantothenate kinase
MNNPSDTELADILAIEVGSSCVKLGRFSVAYGCPSNKPASALPIAAPKLPKPNEEITLAHGRNLTDAARSELKDWLSDNFAAEPRCYLASVQPSVAAQLVQFFEHHGWSAPRQLTWRDMPLEARVAMLERVGIDRLLNAVAANSLRETGRPAIVIDLGTAGTVDLVAADGAFEGGAILPGMALAAQALHSGTSTLPSLDPATLDDSVAAVGKNTAQAIAAGLYWGMVGAIGELIERIGSECPQVPHLFVTGGAAPQVVQHLSIAGESARYVPHLVLSAIRLAAEQLR